MTAGKGNNPRIGFVEMGSFRVAVCTDSLVWLMGSQSLYAFLKSGLPIACVVTRPPFSSSDPQLQCADYLEQIGVPCFYPDSLNDESFAVQFFKTKPSVIASMSFSRRIPDKVLRDVPLGAVGLHRSPLPKYRGWQAIFWQIRDQQKEAGITIFELSNGYDEGKIYRQEMIPLDPDENSCTLGIKSLGVGIPALIDVLSKLKCGENISKITQDPNLLSIAPPVTKETLKINWAWQSAEILSLIRAANPGQAAYTSAHGATLEIISARASHPHDGQLAPGTVVTSSQNFEVACKDKFIILEILQGESGRIYDGEKSLEVFKIKQGDLLGF